MPSDRPPNMSPSAYILTDTAPLALRFVHEFLGEPAATIVTDPHQLRGLDLRGRIVLAIWGDGFHHSRDRELRAELERMAIDRGARIWEADDHPMRSRWTGAPRQSENQRRAQKWETGR